MNFHHRRFNSGFNTELWDLIISWSIVSLVFSIAIHIPFFISFLTVGLGFLFHELSHRFMARHYGLIAVYRSNLGMLLFSLVLSFFGVVLLMPGGVVILGHVSKKKNGVIAMMGPLANIFLSILFLILSLFLNTSIFHSTFYHSVFYYGFLINSYLALFNLLPLPGFDGSKVLLWNKFFYSLLLITSGFLLMLSYTLA